MSRRALSVDFWLANGRSCKMSVSAGGGYLDDVVRFRDGKVHIGVVGAPPTNQNSSRSRSVRYGAADDGCRRESAGLRHQDTRCARPPHALPLGRCGSSRLSSSARDEPKGVSHARLGRSDGPNPSSARPRRWTLWSAWESFLECDWFRTSTAEPVRSGSRRNATVCLLDLSGR
jgi:hypothetical protein